jgi:hypothetical protein
MNTATSNRSLRILNIELLAIDLSTCSRCIGSLSNIEQAIATLQEILKITGTIVQFHKILVESEAQAKQLQLMSSPTIRLNGRDIILETTRKYGQPQTHAIHTNFKNYCYKSIPLYPYFHL